MYTCRLRVTSIVTIIILLFAVVTSATANDDIFTKYKWSAPNSVHPVRVMQWYNQSVCTLNDCSENKWFLGENLMDIGRPFINLTYTPNLGNLIQGVDLGISAWIPQGYTMMYMGDTVGHPNLSGCAEGSPCNDAILILDDHDGAQNGVDARVLLDGSGSNKYQPLLIPGVNTSDDSLPPDAFGPYNVPTGATTGLYIEGNPDNPVTWSMLYLWFATANTTVDATSYLACSYDGVLFSSCSYPYTNPAKRFSQDKFIFVSPILFMGGEMDAIDANDSCTLCKLKRHLTPQWFGYGSGLLLFGARGGPQQDGGSDFKGFRESPLFLAYLDIQSTDTWYFTGSDWTQMESDAQPIIADPENSLYWFGGYSVKRVHQFHSIIMLSNHPGGRVAYRTASLLNPDIWSEPQLTCAVGYGPYIIDQYTTFDYGNPNRLIAYHTISSWNGQSNPRIHEPYGVFTTQLRLRQDPTDPNSPCGQAPVWPPP